MKGRRQYELWVKREHKKPETRREAPFLGCFGALRRQVFLGFFFGQLTKQTRANRRRGQSYGN